MTSLYKSILILFFQALVWANDSDLDSPFPKRLHYFWMSRNQK